MSAYTPRHAAGLLAGVSARERARIDHRRAMDVCNQVDSGVSLLVASVLSAWYARTVQEKAA